MLAAAGVGLVVDADGGHEQVPTNPRAGRGVCQQRGGGPVDGVLAGDAAARSGAGGEHDGVGALQVLGE